MSTAETPTETSAEIRAGAAIRDPLADHLITPQNSALILIDYQPDRGSASPRIGGLGRPVSRILL
jgi:hypothetical protein